MDKPIKNVVRVILEDNGRVLFLKRATKTGLGKWALPGGKVEHGQTLEQACVDELKQETTLDISNIRFFSYQEDLPGIIDENHWITFYFLAGYSGEIKINSESSDSTWMSLDESGKYDIAFGHNKILRDYFGNSFE